MNLSVTFSVKTRKFESFDVLNEIDDVIDFWVWCSRMCSWSLFLKLKFASQCLQIIFKQLICFVCSRSRVIDENWAKHSTHEWYCDEDCETDETDDFAVNSIEIVENAQIKSLSKSCMMMKFDWLLNHAKAKFRKHLSNRSSTFDFRYKFWFWICWKCCRKSIILLYKSKSRISHMRVESKISISTRIDVDFEIFCLTICLTFCLIASIRFLCYEHALGGALVGPYLISGRPYGD